MSSWAIVDNNGIKIGYGSTVPILRPLEGEERLSLKELFVHGTLRQTENVDFRHGSAIGRMNATATPGSYNYDIVGKSLKDIQFVEAVFRKLIGVTDITPPKQQLRLPTFDGFFRRVKFLFWDYPVRGKTSEFTQDEKAPNV